MNRLLHIDHVNRRQEHVMMEQHLEVMDILTVMHDVRNHGIMNIYNIIQALQHGIIHHQRVQQCVPQRQEHVIMEHYEEAIRIVVVHKNIDHVRYVDKLYLMDIDNGVIIHHLLQVHQDVKVNGGSVMIEV